MSESYPHNELEVFVAGYERGKLFARDRAPATTWADLIAEELASRKLSLFNVTREALAMLGIDARFVPREIFDAGVRRALTEAT